jgi:tRNA A37 N6-isopentenylltransferase MiaA
LNCSGCCSQPEQFKHILGIADLWHAKFCLPRLYARIDQRIDACLASGFVEEVRGLLARGYEPSSPSMSGLGYAEIARVLRAQLSLTEAVAQIQASHASVHTKRQMTWFRRRERVHWLNAATAAAEEVIDLLRRRSCDEAQLSSSR